MPTFTDPATDLIATTGSENVYCELRMRRVGVGFELSLFFVEYSAMTGRYIRDELRVGIAEDEDEAIITADDLEHMAYQRLDARNARGWKDPSGFGDAAENLFERSCAVAAE